MSQHVHRDLAHVDDQARCRGERPPWIDAVAVEGARTSPRGEVDVRDLGDRAHRIVSHDVTPVLRCDLAGVHRRVHEPAAEDVVQECLHVPIRAAGRQRELRHVEVGNDLRQVVVCMFQRSRWVDRGVHHVLLPI